MNLMRAAHRLSGGTGTRVRPSPSDHSAMPAKLTDIPASTIPYTATASLASKPPSAR